MCMHAAHHKPLPNASSLPQQPHTCLLPLQASELYLAKRYEESLQAFSEALLLAPEAWHERPKLHCNRAAALIMLHRYGEAVRDCERAVAKDPTLLKAYTRCGRAHLHMGTLDQARRYFQEVGTRAQAVIQARFASSSLPSTTTTTSSSRAQAGAWDRLRGM